MPETKLLQTADVASYQCCVLFLFIIVANGHCILPLMCSLSCNNLISCSQQLCKAPAMDRRKWRKLIADAQRQCVTD